MTYLQRLKELCEKATPGPWEHIEPNADEGDVRVQVYHYHKRNVVHDSDAVAWKLSGNDAQFIAEARTAIPWLIKSLEIAERALEACMQDTLFYAEQICEEGSQGREEGWARMKQANEALAKMREED